jgi:hypothetical protein
VVTFLFTDIEGSTRRWEADAEAMRAALLAHDDVLRTAIEGHGGYVFSHTGDGVVAAFASPRLAVDAAIAAQRAPSQLLAGARDAADGCLYSADRLTCATGAPHSLQNFEFGGSSVPHNPHNRPAAVSAQPPSPVPSTPVSCHRWSAMSAISPCHLRDDPVVIAR